MIGQNTLQAKLNNLTLSNLPHTLLLVGEEGCGKKMFADMIANKVNLPIHKPEKLNLEFVESIYFSNTVTLYVIDTNGITVKEENAILKLLEEPPVQAYIILLANGTNGLLPTVLNRCQVWEFEPYTKDELKSFTGNHPELVNILRTPGKLIAANEVDFTGMQSLVNSVLDKIGHANHSSILSIANKIAFKKEDVGYGYSLFLDVLLAEAFNRIAQGADNFEVYKLTQQLAKDSLNVRYNKQHLFEKYLFKLKEVI